MLYELAYAAVKLYFRLFHRGVQVFGLENLPQGPAVVCPNHEALADPVYVALAAGKKARFHIMAKEELFRKPLSRWFFTMLGAFPVKRGKVDLQALRTSIRLLGERGKLLVFPEGTRTVNGVGLHSGKPVQPKAGAAVIAAYGGVPLVPVLIRHARNWKKTVEVTFCAPMELDRRADCAQAVRQVMEAIERQRAHGEDGKCGS